MKYILIFPVVIIFFLSEVYAQHGYGIRNGEFTEPGVVLYNAQVSCNGADIDCDGVWDAPNLCNWARSHGTPSFDIPGNQIFMTGASITGEGIFGGASFKKDEVYIIQLGIINFNNPGQGGYLHVYAANNMWQGPLPSNCCQDAPPNVPDKELIGGTGQSSFSFAKTIEITYIPTRDFSQIWIYPAHHGGSSLQVNLDFVRIWKCSPGTKSFCNGLIQNTNIYGLHAHEYIQAGSNCAPWGSTVYTDPYSRTTLKAKAILLNENFLGEILPAALPRSQYLLIEPRDVNCSIGVYSDGYNCDPSGLSSAGKPGRTAEEVTYDSYNMSSLQVSDAKNSLNYTTIDNGRRSNGNKNVNIYPNPNQGSFKIQFAEPGNYDINVVNVLGSTVYSGKAEGQQAEIQLDSKLPSGTYTVQISGEGVRHVERVTVTR